MEKKGYSTPEEAARIGTPARFVRVVGVVVRGETAVVAQLMNDVPAYEVETAFCHLETGRWTAGSSSNSTGAFLPTSRRAGSVVVWDEAPDGATGARFEYEGLEQIVAVQHGCALGVFDDVPFEDQWMPRLAAWIDADGGETAVPEPLVSPRERFAELLSRAHGEWGDGTKGVA